MTTLATTVAPMEQTTESVFQHNSSVPKIDSSDHTIKYIDQVVEQSDSTPVNPWGTALSELVALESLTVPMSDIPNIAPVPTPKSLHANEHILFVQMERNPLEESVFPTDEPSPLEQSIRPN